MKVYGYVRVLSVDQNEDRQFQKACSFPMSNLPKKSR
jgi:hypothetical protein